jgi:hypothetical protein
MTTGFYPKNNLTCLALQLACEPGLPWQDSEWATRTELDDDGACRVLPLLVADIPAFVEAVWDTPLPTPFLWSTRESEG